MAGLPGRVSRDVEPGDSSTLWRHDARGNTGRSSQAEGDSVFLQVLRLHCEMD